MATIPINTYDGLVNYMIQESARPNDQEMIDQIPNFILMAQIDLSRTLNIFGTQKIINGIWPQEQNTLVVPNLFVRSVSLTFYDPRHDNQSHVLIYRNNEYAQQVAATNTISSIPTDYAEYNINTLFVAPTPISLYPTYDGFSFQLIYHELFEPLSLVNQQNYFTTRLIDVLKAASMYYLYTFLKDDYFINFYQQAMQVGISKIMEQQQRNQTDRSANWNNN